MKPPLVVVLDVLGQAVVMVYLFFNVAVESLQLAVGLGGGEHGLELISSIPKLISSFSNSVGVQVPV